VSQGFEKTGLGERIANNLLTVCGSSSLQLALGLAAAEVLITPAMPSTTARAAGIFMPVIKSVSQAVGSMPGEIPRDCGVWRGLAGQHVSVHYGSTANSTSKGVLVIKSVSQAVGSMPGELRYSCWVV
jgi:DASS family divalent anion:Na+ symporter